MDPIWQEEFRRRMRRFGRSKPSDGLPISIKVRITSGCFHREHSKEAYRLIDAYLMSAALDEENIEIVEHESGPEILVYLAVTAAGLGFAKSIIELITTIIKARSEGVKKGDSPNDPLELIVRGHSKNDEYFEETILRIPHTQNVSVDEIEEALSLLTEKTRKKPKKAQPKK